MFKKTLAIAVGAAVMAFASSPASADVTYAGQYTYLGAFVAPPNIPNNTFFGRTSLPSLAAFADYYIFDVSESVSVNASANYVPFPSPNGITGWTGGFYRVTAGSTCTVPGAVCTGLTIGANLIGFSTGTGNTFGTTNISAGRYAVLLAGTDNNAQGDTVYSGQLIFRRAVSEPGTLALLGAAVGLAGFMSRRRSK